MAQEKVEQNWVQYLKEMTRIFEEAGEEAKLTDKQLDKLENLLGAALSVVEFIKSQREEAYQAAQGHPADKNNQTRI